jgi:hypothetical protein
VYWRGDVAGDRFRVRPSAGPQDQDFVDGCGILRGNRPFRPAAAGSRVKPLPVYRAPGGKTSAKLRRRRGCGYQYVRMVAGRLLGGNLPSETHSNHNFSKSLARHPAGRHPSGTSGHLVAQGPLGAS